MVSKTDEIAARQLWIDGYLDEHGRDRDDLLRNPGTLFQLLAWQIALYRAIGRTNLQPKESKVLDVGCGRGAVAGALIQSGFNPENLYGVDLLPEHIYEAQKKYPGCNFTATNARMTDFPDGMFDLVLEFGVFIRLPDEQAIVIAQEMKRVLKPSGFVLLIDWRYGHPLRKNYYPLSRDRRSTLFPELEAVAAMPGPLLPPLGRALSSVAPSVYFLIQKLFPPLVGQLAWLLRKANT